MSDDRTKMIGNLSPSKLKSIRLCEARLFAKVDRNEEYEEERGEAAAAGTLAHEAAKIWYRHEADTLDEAFKKAIEECAHGLFGNELPAEAQSVQDGRTLFEQIASFYKRDAVRAVFAERRYKGTLANGVPIHCIVDLALDYGNGKLTIIDFKTGFLTMTTEEMWSEDQVLLNLLVISQDQDPALNAYRDPFGNVKAEFRYFWVRHGVETGPVELSQDRLSDYEAYLAMEYQRILNVQEPKENINPFCNSCGRRFKCKKYREMVAEALGDLQGVDEQTFDEERLKSLSMAEVMAHHSKINNQMKLLDKHKKTIGAFLLDQHKQQEAKILEDGQFKSSLRQNKSTSFSTSTVLSLCQSKGVDPAPLLSVSKKAVESAFGTDEEAMSLLNMTAQKHPISPYVVVTASSPKTKKKSTKKKSTKKKSGDDQQDLLDSAPG